jgi:hypothetical protein
MVRPFALEVGPGGFPFATGHRRIAISLLAGTLIRTGISMTVDFIW